MTKPVIQPDGSPFALRFTQGLPSEYDGRCIYLLDDGSIHAGQVTRTKAFPRGCLVTKEHDGGGADALEIPIARVVGWASAAPRDAERRFGPRKKSRMWSGGSI